MAMANTRSTFSTSNGSPFVIILYAMPAAMMMANIAPRAMQHSSIHQNGPLAPINVASVRNSFVWKMTSSISSSNMSMPILLTILSTTSGIAPACNIIFETPISLFCCESTAKSRNRPPQEILFHELTTQEFRPTNRKRSLIR